MAYEVYTYFNTDEIITVLNGVAAILGGSDYLGLVKTVLVFGVIVALITPSLSQRSFAGMNWFIGAMIVYFGLMVPKVEVTVIDRTHIQPTQVVANVPLGLGFFAHATSKIGDYLTRQYETNFVTFSDSLKLENGGGGINFGSQVVKEMRRAVIVDSDLRKDMYEYIRNCVVPQIQHGAMDARTISTATDVWAAIQISSETAFLSQITNAGVVTMTTCDAVYTNLTGRLDIEADQASNNAAASLFPNQMATLGQAAVRGMFNSAATDTTTLMMGVSDTAQQTIRQNMLVNLMDSSGAYLAQQTSDPAALQLALSSAQAEASANASYLSMAKVAESAMPKIRNVMSMICYAVFPIILILMLVAGHEFGSIFKTYLITLLWLELWPPLYAVLNLVVTMDAARKAQAIAAATGGSMTIQTAGDIGQAALSSQAISGYMVVLVPTIAYSVVKGMEGIAGAVGNMLAPGQAAAQSAGSSVGAGNINMGNTQIGNHSDNIVRSNSLDTKTHMDGGRLSSEITDHFGNTLRTAASGAMTVAVASNSTNLTAGSRLEMASRYSHQANVKEAQAEQLMAQRSEDVGAMFSTVTGSANKLSAGSRLQFDTTEGTRAVTGAEITNMKSVLERDAEGTGLTSSDMAQFKAGINEGMSADQSLRKVLGQKGAAGEQALEKLAKHLGISGRSSADAGFSQQVANTLDKRLSHEKGTSEDKAYRTLETLQFAYGHNKGGVRQDGKETGLSNSLQDTLGRGTKSTESLSKTRSEIKELNEAASVERSNAIRIEDNLSGRANLENLLKATAQSVLTDEKAPEELKETAKRINAGGSAIVQLENMNNGNEVERKAAHDFMTRSMQTPVQEVENTGKANMNTVSGHGPSVSKEDIHGLYADGGREVGDQFNKDRDSSHSLYKGKSGKEIEAGINNLESHERGIEQREQGKIDDGKKSIDAASAEIKKDVKEGQNVSTVQKTGEDILDHPLLTVAAVAAGVGAFHQAETLLTHMRGPKGEGAGVGRNPNEPPFISDGYGGMKPNPNYSEPSLLDKALHTGGSVVDAAVAGATVAGAPAAVGGASLVAGYEAGGFVAEKTEALWNPYLRGEDDGLGPEAIKYKRRMEQEHQSETINADTGKQT